MTVDSAHGERGTDGDKVTVGPSQANREVLERLVEQKIFKTSLGAFQAAAMLALRNGLDTSTAPVSGGTMWNRGSVDPQVLEFLEWYIPTETPVRVLERLGNAGADYIAAKVKVGGYTLTEIFGLSQIDAY